MEMLISNSPKEKLHLVCAAPKKPREPANQIAPRTFLIEILVF
jgi:hypothetical protein